MALCITQIQIIVNKNSTNEDVITDDQFDEYESVLNDKIKRYSDDHRLNVDNANFSVEKLQVKICRLILFFHEQIFYTRPIRFFNSVLIA